MFTLIAFAVLVLAWYAGALVISTTGAPIPAPLIGLLLVFCGLVVMRRVPESLDRVAQLLLRHLSVMFVPATLAVMLYSDKLAEHGWALALALVCTTAVSLLLTAFIARYSLNRRIR